MRIINVVPEMDQLQLGKQGENKSTKFLFDVSDWLEKYPGCTITLVNRRPNENSSYPCVLTTEEDGRRGWVINSADLAIDGKGECELKCTLVDMIEKDKRTWKTKVKKSLSGDGDAPAPWESLMDDIEALVGDAQDAAEDAEEAKEAAEEAASIAAHAPIIQDGYWYEWDATTEQYVNTEVKAQGEDGDPGQDATPDLITVDYSDLTFPVAAGTMCYHSGLLYKANNDIETSEAWTAAHWTQTTIEEEHRALKTEVRANPRIVETEENTADLYIADADGYVLAQFSGGHIKTQKFDSSVEKVDANQGSENAGKIMTVGDDGEVVPSDKKVESDTSVEQTEETGLVFDLADPHGYVIARFKNGHIQTKNFNSENVVGFEYKISNNNLMISYGYTDSNDIVIVLNRGRANNLFDFYKIGLKPVEHSLDEYEENDLVTIWSSGTDMHGPFQFLATSNKDGIHSDATDAGWTGGNHTLDDLGAGYETASSQYVHYFADGKPVETGSGKASSFCIRWANDVQAYNTVKADGTGRSCLTEYHEMIFDGVKFNETVTLIPSEEIKMELWYGFQFVSWGTTYNRVRFTDSTNRQIFKSTDSGIVSGNSATSGITAWGDDHEIELTIDTNVDLGKRLFYSGNNGAFISSTKGYFTVILQDVLMEKDNAYVLKGSFRFVPTEMNGVEV